MTKKEDQTLSEGTPRAVQVADTAALKRARAPELPGEQPILQLIYDRVDRLPELYSEVLDTHEAVKATQRDLHEHTRSNLLTFNHHAQRIEELERSLRSQAARLETLEREHAALRSSIESKR